MDSIFGIVPDNRFPYDDIIGGDNIENIGFIGAGKCGMSLGHYFRSKGMSIVGFSSRHKTNIDFDFLDYNDLINKSDIIFVTVTDTAISEVWNGLQKYDLHNKIICHCSGSLSSDIFVGTDKDMVCSVHPMLAFNSKHTSEENISNAYFTLEGGKTAVDRLSRILSKCSNNFRIIKKENKVLYHAAACFASNFVVAVCEKAEELLSECGFDRQSAHDALTPLMSGNMENIINAGTRQAITGPAIRGDMITIQKHLDKLDDETKDIYKGLTNIILDMKSEEHI